MLFAGSAACAVDGSQHIGTPESLLRLRRHNAARRATLGALGVSVVTDVDPREAPAVVAALGEELGCVHAWRGGSTSVNH